ncbi:unnamed protein product [Amoebophrya sp. A120]|nr:unnamed protein product [Amoebophrya sp. A120]|eukprot:GSA120T00024937001.1
MYIFRDITSFGPIDTTVRLGSAFRGAVSLCIVFRDITTFGLIGFMENLGIHLGLRASTGLFPRMRDMTVPHVPLGRAVVARTAPRMLATSTSARTTTCWVVAALAVVLVPSFIIQIHTFARADEIHLHTDVEKQLDDISTGRDNSKVHLEDDPTFISPQVAHVEHLLATRVLKNTGQEERDVELSSIMEVAGGAEGRGQHQRQSATSGAARTSAIDDDTRHEQGAAAARAATSQEDESASASFLLMPTREEQEEQLHAQQAGTSTSVSASGSGAGNDLQATTAQQPSSSSGGASTTMIQVAAQQQQEEPARAAGVPVAAPAAAGALSFEERLRALEEQNQAQREEIEHLQAQAVTHATAVKKHDAQFHATRDIGSLTDEIMTYQYAVHISRLRIDYVHTIVFVGYGFLCILVGLLYPCWLVFMPMSYDDEYLMLPHDFVLQGTISSVTQSTKTGQGRIWTTCLVAQQVCLLLSRYTTVIYDSRNSISEYDVKDNWTGNEGQLTVRKPVAFLDKARNVINREPFHYIVLRIIWLVVPAVCLIFTAAVPSATDEEMKALSSSQISEGTIPGREQDEPGEGKNAEREQLQEQQQEPHDKYANDKVQELGTSARDREKTTPDDVVNQIARANAMFKTVVHRYGATVGMGTLLIFETWQLFWVEDVNLGVALFGCLGTIRPAGNSDSSLSSWTGVGSAKLVALEQYWKFYFVRAWLLLSGWAFCFLFLVCTFVLGTRKKKGFGGQEVLLGGFRRRGAVMGLVHKETTLYLPRAAFLLEVGAVLAVFSLPFLPILTDFAQAKRKLHSFTSMGSVIFADLGEEISRLYDMFWVILVECGTFWDFVARPPACRDQGGGKWKYWFEMTIDETNPTAVADHTPYKPNDDNWWGNAESGTPR